MQLRDSTAPRGASYALHPGSMPVGSYCGMRQPPPARSEWAPTACRLQHHRCSGWSWGPSLLTATAALQDRASLPDSTGCGAGVRSQQLGELCSLLVRVSGRLPRGPAPAHPAVDGRREGQRGESLPQKNPTGAAGKHHRCSSQRAAVQGTMGKRRKMAG